MAMDTVVLQGRFTSAGIPVTLNLRSDVDWIYVYNETILNDAALAADRGAWFQWNRGMLQGRGLEYQKLGTVANDPITTVQIAANAGFFLFDSTISQNGPAVAETGITNAAQPVVTTANTGLLATGSIVRLNSDTNVPNIMGFDFEVDAVNIGANFRMRYPMANVPGAAGAGNGFYRQIYFDPMFYPRHRFIVNVTTGATTLINTSVTHQYTVGQKIRFTVPTAFGMTELNGLTGTVTAVVTVDSFMVDIDSTAFTAFVFPAVAAVPFSWALAIPIGEDTGAALLAGVDILAGATVNEGELGLMLMAGNDSPAGANNDVIYWIAGKSFSIDNR